MLLLNLDSTSVYVLKLLTNALFGAYIRHLVLAQCLKDKIPRPLLKFTWFLTLLHSKGPKLHRVLAILSAIGLKCFFLLLFFVIHKNSGESRECHKNLISQ